MSACSKVARRLVRGDHGLERGDESRLPGDPGTERPVVVQPRQQVGGAERDRGLPLRPRTTRRQLVELPHVDPQAIVAGERDRVADRIEPWPVSLLPQPVQRVGQPAAGRGGRGVGPERVGQGFAVDGRRVGAARVADEPLPSALASAADPSAVTMRIGPKRYSRMAGPGVVALPGIARECHNSCPGRGSPRDARERSQVSRSLCHRAGSRRANVVSAGRRSSGIAALLASTSPSAGGHRSRGHV